MLENVIGKTPKEASNLLTKFNIEYSGVGNIVVEQSPEPGIKIKEGSKVRLMLGN